MSCDPEKRVDPGRAAEAPLEGRRGGGGGGTQARGVKPCVQANLTPPGPASPASPGVKVEHSPGHILSSVGQWAEHQLSNREKVSPPLPQTSHPTFLNPAFPLCNTEPLHPPGPSQSCMGFCLRCPLTILSVTFYTSSETQPQGHSLCKAFPDHLLFPGPK